MVLQASIEREKKGVEYIYSEQDKNILKLMLNELNLALNSDFQYLAELDLQNIVGAGKIFVKWIEKFSSHTIKSILFQQIIADKVKDSDILALRLYNEFKNSNEYIASKGMSSPAHIYVRYDNAFSKLKSQRIQNELLNLMKLPRDAFYLPLTFRMLSSKKLPEFEHILFYYSDEKNINCDMLGIDNSGEYYPSITFIQRELKFSCIYGLRFYPSQNTLKILDGFLKSNDDDIKKATQKTIRYIETHK